MHSIVNILCEKNLIKPPIYVKEQIQYEVIMGSYAYGVSNDLSDLDIYGFCIPNKDMIFPHLKGEIIGFGRQKKRFDQFQIHHIVDNETNKGFDISIYNIVKYFQLCMENNPNMIDSLFVPQRCVIHCTQIGDLVRQNRKLFLHKGAFYKFKGYAYSQLHKIESKNPIGKRKQIIEQFGFDVKFAYHVVRLLCQIEQILIENDLDLERNREQLKSIRRGEWSLEEIKTFFNEKEKSLETLYSDSKLQNVPNEHQIKELLLNCLEIHFGSLDNCIKRDYKIDDLLDDLKSIVSKYS